MSYWMKEARCKRYRKFLLYEALDEAKLISGEKSSRLGVECRGWEEDEGTF